MSSRAPRQGSPATATDAARPASMKAAVYRRFGGPEVVRLEQRPTPVPRRDEVLVRVRASTVSAADHRSRAKDIPRGLALPSAIVLGVFRPRVGVLGMDAAGVVEAVGTDVTRFAPGDEVVAMLGAGFGGHAEYVALPERGPIAIKPRHLCFEDSVALVFGGVTAQAYLKRTHLTAGVSVLVNGASGAVGTAALQLAKMAGAHVNAVTSVRNTGLARSLGADRVIDYNATDFAAESTTYDVVLDAVGNVSFGRMSGTINPGGTLLQVVADLADVLCARRRSRRSGKTIVAGNVPFTADDMVAVVAAAEAGHYRPVIDRTVDLTDIVDAHRYVDTGRKRGSVVVRISGPAATAA